MWIEIEVKNWIVAKIYIVGDRNGWMRNFAFHIVGDNFKSFLKALFWAV